ncbi:gb [Venturia nashicola]|nr:gb [Venturia nashicola]
MALPRRYYSILIVTLVIYLFLYRSSSLGYSHPAVAPSNDDLPLKLKLSDNGAEHIGPDPETPAYVGNLSEIYARPPAASLMNSSPDHSKQEADKPVPLQGIRITITESGGSHDEVTAALIHAFGNQESVEISTYLLLQRYGIADIIHGFNLSSPLVSTKPPNAFEASLDASPLPHILIAATCEIEIVELAKAYEMLLLKGKTFLFCVVHHAERWVEGKLVDKIRPWVEEERVHFIGLSEHTVKYLRQHCVPNWDMAASVLADALPPVFPIAIEAPMESNTALTFALQGDYDLARRDYTSIFEGLSEIIDLVQNRSMEYNQSVPQTITLRLIGHGDNKPEVPELLKSHVSFDEGLDYKLFYTLLSRTFTLLPSFASKDYYDVKASSTIPAALIAGTPLVANTELLEAYTYVPKNAVWKQEEGESEMDVVRRVVQMSQIEHEKRREVVREVCSELVERNIELVREWIKGGLERIRVVS